MTWCFRELGPAFPGTPPSPSTPSPPTVAVVVWEFTQASDQFLTSRFAQPLGCDSGILQLLLRSFQDPGNGHGRNTKLLGDLRRRMWSSTAEPEVQPSDLFLFWGECPENLGEVACIRQHVSENTPDIVSKQGQN